MTLTVVKEHTPRHFTSFITNSGVVLCDDQDGAFLCLRFPEELVRLRALLADIDVAPRTIIETIIEETPPHP